MNMRPNPAMGFLLQATIGLSLGLADENQPPVVKPQPKFVSMFDGKSLDGWKVMPADGKSPWSVVDGIIIGNGDKGRNYLAYAKNLEVADFEMEFSYRFPKPGNSGVNIRARKDPTGRRAFQAYHADLGHVGFGILGSWDFHTPGRTEHACFRGDRLVIDENDKPTVTKIAKAATDDDMHKYDWNRARIVARGNNFKFFLNGKLSSEFTEHLPTRRRLTKGMIQLQIHDPGMVIHYKDLRIKVLD